MSRPASTHRLDPEAGETVATVLFPAKKPAVVVWDGVEVVYIDPASSVADLTIDQTHKDYIVETLRGTALGVERNWNRG